MTAPTIRTLTIEDYAEVRALWEATEGVGLSASDSLDGVRKVLDRNPGMSFVAVSGKRIVGAVLVGHDGRRGLVHHLTVEPSFRRRGLGRALVRRAIEALRGAGIDKAHFLVFARNEAGRAFWKRMLATERIDLVLFSMNTG